MNDAPSKILAPESESARAAFTAREVIEGYVALGQLAAYTGDMTKSVKEFERAYALAQTQNPAALPDLGQMLAIASVHETQIDNGLFTAPGDRCLVSTKDTAPLTKSEAFDSGVRRLQAALDKRPDDIELKWFLNAAFLSVGGYPGRVPAKYAIPTTAFESPEDVGKFVDVAAPAGINSFSSAGGSS